MSKKYLINGSLSGKVNVPTSFITYTGEETDTARVTVDNKTRKIKADVKVEEVVKDCATKEELRSGLATKQDTLVSGENIKTINGQSVLGPGNVEINSGVWGNITGDISDQLDLQEEFEQKYKEACDYADSKVTKGRTISDLEISCPPISYGIAGGEAEISTGIQKLETLYGNTPSGVQSAKLVSRGKNQFEGFWTYEDQIYNDVIGGEEYKIFGLPSGFLIREIEADKTYNEGGMDEDFVPNYGVFTLKENTRYIQIFPADSSEVNSESEIMLYITFGESYDEEYEEPRVDEIILPNLVLRSVGEVRDEIYSIGGGIRRISSSGQILEIPEEITTSENPGWDQDIFIDNYGTLMFVDSEGNEIQKTQPYSIIYSADLIEFLDSTYAKAAGNASDIALESDLEEGKIIPALTEGIHTERVIDDLAISCPPITYGIAGGDAEISTGIQDFTKVFGNTIFDEENQIYKSSRSAKLIARGKNQFSEFGEFIDVLSSEEYRIFTTLPSGLLLTEYWADKECHAGYDDYDISTDCIIGPAGSPDLEFDEETRYIKLEPVDSEEVNDKTEVMMYLTFGESYDEPYEEPQIEEVELPNIELRSIGDVRDEIYATGGGIRRIGCTVIDENSLIISDAGDAGASRYNIHDLQIPQDYDINKILIEPHGDILNDSYFNGFYNNEGYIAFDVEYDAVMPTYLLGTKIYYIHADIIEPGEDIDYEPITEEENPGWDKNIFIDNYGTLLFTNEEGNEVKVEQPYEILYHADLKEFLDSSFVRAAGDASDIALVSELENGECVPFKSEYAENLTPYSDTSGVNSNNAFLFQTSGGDSDIGDKAYLEDLTGNTAKLIQLVKNGNFADGTDYFEGINGISNLSANNGKLKIQCSIAPTQYTSIGAEQSVKMLCNRSYSNRYYLKFILNHYVVNNNSMITVVLRYRYNSGTAYYQVPIYNSYLFKDNNGKNQTISLTITPYPSTSDNLDINYVDLVISLDNFSSQEEYIQLSNVEIIDLFALKESLGGEWNTDKFNKEFPLEYYEYTDGKFVSSKTAQYRTVGYNACNEDWEIGYYTYNGIGTKVYRGTGDLNTFRLKEPIRLVPGQNYTIEFTRDYQKPDTYLLGQILITDINNNYIQSFEDLGPGDDFISIPDNGYYAFLYFVDDNDETVYETESDIPQMDCAFHLTWDKSKTGYEKYYSKTYKLPNIELRRCHDVYDELKPDGTLIRRVGIVDLGSLNWTYEGVGADIFTTTDLSQLIKRVDLQTALSAIVETSEYNVVAYADSGRETKEIFGDLQGGVSIYYDHLSDPDELKRLLNGIHLIFELATPTTEQNDAYRYEEITDIDDFGTQEFISSAEIAIPQGNKFFYPSDYKAFIDTLGGRNDVKYDASKIFTKTDYNKILCSTVNERRIFATPYVIAFKKEGGNDNYIPINPITIFAQSYAITRREQPYYLRLYNKQKLNWSQFKGTKKGNYGIGTLYDDDFSEGLGPASKYYTLDNLIDSFIMPFNTDKYSISIDSVYHNFKSLGTGEKPHIYDYTTEDWTQELELDSKTVYEFSVDFENPVYFDDLVVLNGSDAERNRNFGGYIPGENLFIALNKSFNRFADMPVFKIAGKASIRFGLSRGDYGAKQHQNTLVSAHQTIIQNTYLDLQCLYEFQQDLVDDPGLITGLKIYLGVSPKQFK